MSAKRHNPAVTGSFREAIAALSKVLVTKPNFGMIIGGIAVIARGVPRTTRDVDATVDGGALSLEDLLEAFKRESIVPRIDDAIAFALDNQVLLLRHAPSTMDIDVSIAWLPFELEAIAACETVRLGDLRVPMARAEDLLIYKTIAWRPQDQQDAERLLSLYGKQIDIGRVRKIVGEFAAILEDSQRLEELDRVIARTSG